MQEITPELISDVLNRTNIVDVVSEHITLEPAENGLRGACPFHSQNNENNPFLIKTDTRIFKCLACGEGGDVFAFVMKIESVCFIDSVRHLISRSS